MPYIFVADDAFAMKPFLLKPFSGRELDGQKKIFNYRLSRSRRIVENLFGILTNRWRIYHSTIGLQPEFVERIVMATLILHNILRKNRIYCSPGFADTQTSTGKLYLVNGDLAPPCPLFEIQRRSTGHNITIEAKEVRDEYADYMMNEGQIQWQWDKL